MSVGGVVLGFLSGVRSAVHKLLSIYTLPTSSYFSLKTRIFPSK